MTFEPNQHNTRKCQNGYGFQNFFVSLHAHHNHVHTGRCSTIRKTFKSLQIHYMTS